MANPTTNYSFVLPTSTDLVTDLPADFDVALQGVDTRLKALQPGTTAGDLAYTSTTNTNLRLGIGATGTVLTVASGAPSWAAPASFSTSFTLLNSGGTALSGAAARTVSFSAQNSLLIHVQGASCTGAEQIMLNMNSDTTTNYREIGSRFSSTGVQTSCDTAARADFRIGSTALAAGTITSLIFVQGAKGTTTPKPIILNSAVTSTDFTYIYNGLYNGTSAITSITIQSNSSNFDAGTVFVFGA